MSMSTLRGLLLVGLILGLTLRGISGEGGDNAGGTGIWILPQAGSLTQGPPGAPRAVLNLASLNQDVNLSVSVQCGMVSASFVDGLSQAPVSLPVTGSVVRLHASLLQAMAAAGSTHASIVIVDAAQVGYRIEVVVDCALRTAIIKVM
jgi:hypothetical protein